MPPMRSASFVFCTLLLPASLGAQPPQRDPQAVAIAQRALLAMGGANLPTIQDTVARGTVTFAEDGSPTQGTLTLKTRGLRQLRADFVMSGGTSSAVYNAGRGAMRNADGTVRQYGWAQTINKRADHLPLFSMLAEYADPSVGVRLPGVEMVNGASAWRLEFQRQLPPQDDPQKVYALFARCEVFVDQASLLVIKLRYDVPAVGSLLDRHPMEFQYGDYRPEGGLVLPHTIVQSVAGSPIAIYQITSFAVNSGLSDADFILPR